MKNLKTFSLAAISLLGFAACQQVEISPDVKPEATHTVTFVAGAPETKTTVNIDGTTAKFKWTADDINRITLYENGVPATETKGALTDGLMTIKATFDGSATEGENTYIAVVNSSNDLQIMYGEAYDESTDILVSKAVSSFDGVNGVQLQFRREVAIAKMTLKGLDANEEINSITVSSNATIANKYTVNGWSKEYTDAKTELQVVSEYSMGVKTGYKIAANASGEAVVWFTCIPQDEATLTVKVEAADGDTYTKEFSKPITLSRGDVNVFGVAMTKALPSVKTFSLVTSSPADWCGEYVLVAANSGKYYAFDKTLTTENKWGVASEISIENSAIVPSSEGMVITIVKGTSEGTYSIKTNDGNYLSASSKGAFNYGTTYNKDNCDFTISLSDNSVTITQNASTASSKRNLRYNYNGGAGGFRWYDGTTGVLASLYAESGIKYILPSPTNLIVNSETKQVTWDAVADAASYVLTIGSDEFPCETNSYDAKAIADEYYDVAVVAVPSDTENYKNSDAATLTDAKFGTPTLATPTLKEGAVDEFSVNATWTEDTRATAGYNCELYNGEIKIGDSKTVKSGSVTFDGLDDGVTYTIKVNAIAVEGTKAYAASSVATIDLTTKGTTKISEISATGTYTVKNAIVYAIPNSYTAIISDGTGMMLLNDDSKHGFSVGAQLLTIAGTVEVTNGIYQFKNPSSTKASEDLVTPDYGEPVEASAEYLASKPNKIVYVHLKGSQSGRNISVGSGSSIQKLYLNTTYSSTDNKEIEAYGFIYGYNESFSTTNFIATSITEDPTAPKLSVSPTSKTWESEEVDAVTFTVTTNAEGENGWSVTPTTLDWATIAVDKSAGTITVKPKDANTTKTAHEAILKVTHSAGTLSETITLTQNAAGSTGGEVKTYQHVFNTKPSTGNNITLSGVQWNITATSLNGYNSTNYAGVQIGSKNGNGQITLTSPSAWSYTKDEVTVTKIKEVRLWLNLGGTSVTPSVTIGGVAAISDGTKVTKNSNAGTDWTKATKVTFTPAAGSNTGVIVIDVTSVKAGYICAIEIDAECLPSGECAVGQ